ncbi:MAG: class I SAM-dependent methyltransferase [Lewinellaceae bacterium]|jgi:23S rRNA (cytosine1962-C5)-methyltransferase|nr:class I SAM-dependent methyltransferase [Lewinellaceae bacterium]
MMNPKLEPFANRLAKMHKHLGKWARRQNISCYRVYDNDIPGTPLAIDIYENIVHVAEYARDHGMEPGEHAAWLDDCIAVIGTVLGVSSDLIFLKFRQRQKGLSQYDRFARTGAEFIVRENGLRFIINPADYLDVGLFLDHRITRQMVRQESHGKKVLNLFAYTGSFSVYAAAGEAAETLTVDMSNTYLQWANRNLSLNGFEDERHRLLQADVMTWLEQPPQERFDLIVVDPPTFSNSKRMEGTLDIQRDHVLLLNRVLRFCSPGGVVYFSTNNRRFKIWEEEIRAAEIRDISRQTVPEDFRNKKIHQCFRIVNR